MTSTNHCSPTSKRIHIKPDFNRIMKYFQQYPALLCIIFPFYIFRNTTRCINKPEMNRCLCVLYNHNFTSASASYPRVLCVRLSSVIDGRSAVFRPLTASHANHSYSIKWPREINEHSWAEEMPSTPRVYHCRLVIVRYWFFITDTDYLYVYVPDMQNRYYLLL